MPIVRRHEGKSMALFKYFSPDVEYDPVGERKLMVTPPKFFADPFEFKPIIKCKDPQEYAYHLFGKISASPAYFNANRNHFVEFSFGEFKARLEGKKAEILERLEEGIHQTDRKTQDDLLELVSRSFGVICFTGSATNQQLWERYKSHMGFAVEFREDHILFSGRSFLHVEYSDDPVIYDASAVTDRDQVELFIKRKTMDWRYEEESRLIVDLAFTAPENTTKGVRHFLPIPSELIVSVTLGLHASDELKKKVLGALRIADFRHVQLFKIERIDKKPEFRRRPL
jgi:hypothetical protein